MKLLALPLILSVALVGCGEQKHTNTPAVSVKPAGADMYDPATEQWLCAINKDPVTGNADGYYPCPNGTTEKERKAVIAFDACVKRSGKEPQTMGWDWAASECRKNTNSF